MILLNFSEVSSEFQNHIALWRDWASRVVLVVKNLPTNTGGVRATGSVPGSGNPLQCFFLENHMDRGAWQAAVHRVAQSQTHLKPLSTRACTWREWAQRWDSVQHPWENVLSGLQSLVGKASEPLSCCPDHTPPSCPAPQGHLEGLVLQGDPVAISFASEPHWVQGAPGASPYSPLEKAQESLHSRIPQ